MFAKIQLVNELFALVQSVGPLLSAGGALLPGIEALGLEAVGVVRNLSLAGATQFVADAKQLWASAMAAYNGQSESLAAFEAAFAKLIADTK